MQDLAPLRLSPRALIGAQALQAVHPEVIFTSGRRNLVEQARAMAANVMHNRHWIGGTYTDTPQRQALQFWVDDHPHGVLLAEIAAGLLGVMKHWTDEELAHVSKHLNGEAFDVQPVSGPAGEAIKATIRTLPGLTKFLDHEGGLTRWHVQFG